MCNDLEINEKSGSKCDKFPWKNEWLLVKEFNLNIVRMKTKVLLFFAKNNGCILIGTRE